MIGNTYIPRNIEKILSSKSRSPGYWQKKSDPEIEDLKQRIRKSSFNMTMPLGILFITFAACFFFMPIMANRSVYCLLISLFISLLTFVYQIYSGRALASSPSFKICNQCFKEDRIGLKKCPCGGMFESPEFFNFIEDNSKTGD